MVGPGGKLGPASLVAEDTTSDIALVNVPVDVPVAPFANDTGLGGGSPDLLLSFVPAGGASLALHCTPGAVTGVGTAIAGGPADGMPAITSSPATTPVAAGDPLLNSSGGVVGILYDPDPGTSSRSPSCPPTSWSGSPTTSARGTGWCTGGSGSRAPMPPAAAGPRWRPCRPTGRPPGGSRRAR